MNNYWDKFPKTDQNYTKQNNEGGRKSTAITPIYMVKLATQVLGPIGEGWGYRIIEERFDNTCPIVLIDGDKPNGKLPVYLTDNGQMVWEKTHTVLMEMWVGCKENTFTQYGHTKYSYMTKNGKYYVDHEYGKKSITDAMTKCLSLVGVCSDVYMGEFDDIEYREAAQVELAIEKADDQAAEIEKRTQELNDHIEQHNTLMDSCPNMGAVGKVYAKARHKAELLAKALKLDPAQAIGPLDAKYFEVQKKLGAQ
jgi:hypothetical protein